MRPAACEVAHFYEERLFRARLVQRRLPRHRDDVCPDRQRNKGLEVPGLDEMVVSPSLGQDVGVQTENDTKYETPTPRRRSQQASPSIEANNGNFGTVHSDMFMSEMTAMYHILGAIRTGGDGAKSAGDYGDDDAWKHTCSFGPIAALASLKQRAKECQGQMDLLRSMVSSRHMAKQQAIALQQQHQQRQLALKKQQTAGHVSYFQQQQQQQFAPLKMNQSHTQQQQQKGGNSFGILPVVSKSQTNTLGGSASGGSISGIKGENTVEKSYTYHQQQEHQHGNSQRGRVGMVARKAATGGNGRSGSKSARRTGHEAPAILQQQQQHTVMLLQKKRQLHQQFNQHQQSESSRILLAFPKDSVKGETA